VARVQFERFKEHLSMPIITLTLLGAIESLLRARMADGLIGDRHNPNQELMAQGVANFVTPFFGGMPATGTIARTVTNVKSGGQVARCGHGACPGFTLCSVLVAAPLANHIPLATLAAILMFVAWNMGEWHAFTDLEQFQNALSHHTAGCFLAHRHGGPDCGC
jgi:SulP family sulfate permease